MSPEQANFCLITNDNVNTNFTELQIMSLPPTICEGACNTSGSDFSLEFMNPFHRFHRHHHAGSSLVNMTRIRGSSDHHDAAVIVSQGVYRKAHYTSLYLSFIMWLFFFISFMAIGILIRDCVFVLLVQWDKARSRRRMKRQAESNARKKSPRLSHQTPSGKVKCDNDMEFRGAKWGDGGGGVVDGKTTEMVQVF